MLTSARSMTTNAPKNQQAYATLLTDDSYLSGVQVLSYTLRKVTTKPLVVLVSQDKTKVHRATVI